MPPKRKGVAMWRGAGSYILPCWLGSDVGDSITRVMRVNIRDGGRVATPSSTGTFYPLN